MNSKHFIFLILLILLYNNLLISQKDSVINNYVKCIEYLERVKPALLMDTSGEFGIRDVAVEYLIDENCMFINELLPSFLYYFGKPNRITDYTRLKKTNNLENSNKRFIRAEYLLNLTSPRNRTGQKYLFLHYDEFNRITKFEIFTIDE